MVEPSFAISNLLFILVVCKYRPLDPLADDRARIRGFNYRDKTWVHNTNPMTEIISDDSGYKQTTDE